MDEGLDALKKTYQKFLATGLGLMLVAFALMILQPRDRSASLVLAVIVFLLAFIPLEIAKRIARKMAVMALRGE